MQPNRTGITPEKLDGTAKGDIISSHFDRDGTLDLLHSET